MFTKWWMEYLSSRKKGALARTLTLLSLCFILVAATGCSLLPNEDEEEVLPVITPPTVSKKPEYEVTSGPIELKVSAVGKLMSQREEALYFTEDGLHIQSVLVKAGDKVKKGDTLIQLDVKSLQKDLRKKRLDFRQQEISMKETLRTKEEMDEIEFEKAAIVFEEQRQELADLEQKIADGTLKAPFAGTIVSIKAEKGATVKSYDSLGIISDTSSLVVAASFAKEDLAKLSVGMKAKVDINAAGEFAGKVKVMPVNTASTNDNNNNDGGNNANKDSIDKYLIIELDKWPSDVERGRPLSASIVTQRKENATLIPIAALRTVGSRTYVQVIEDDGSKREVDVEVGLQTATEMEILKGLTPGQKVVGR
ncbi:membrane fusion protein, macrolide-specific efflux system [Fontibacillus panacisegetis]|uniref:Membrane fusion protein, macrolide-specific efflux system n=1 Tax=Fontibacillus panacisegetis TaxID=670482 RepID=A0A1G7FJU3_9BACL|nr:efflux RND transporter periplasmic adaptor subunit [Fontibacillus panacisegetis]SDE76109.1 membrane fusion protein, macrolide-specific efflux system [Fontibacillus panacisegetis]